MIHTTELIVRPYECDSYNHVNNAVYQNYLEYARMDFLHAAGFNYKKIVAEGYYLVDYNPPYKIKARYGNVPSDNKERRRNNLR